MTSFDELSDKALMAKVRDGNKSAFATLVNRHCHKYYAIAYRTTFNKEDAEDIVQEAFLKLWIKPDRWNPHKQTQFTTWFYKVVVNLSLDGIRKKRPLNLNPTFEIEDAHPSVEGDMIKNETRLAVEKQIKHLPKRQIVALNLCFYEGLSYKEAASIMDISVKALESLVMRAKSTLKQAFKQHNSAEEKRK